MKIRHLLNLVLLILFFSCNMNPKNNESIKNINYSIKDIDIPSKWIEIPERNTNKSIFQREIDFKELRTIELKYINGKEAIIFKDRYEFSSFEIRNIEKSKDSLIFNCILPEDSTDIIRISMKYLDNDKFIARWIIDNIQSNYFPYKDSIGNNKVRIQN